MPEAKNLAAMLEDLQKAQKVCGAACVRAGPPARALAARPRQRRAHARWPACAASGRRACSRASEARADAR